MSSYGRLNLPASEFSKRVNVYAPGIDESQFPLGVTSRAPVRRFPALCVVIMGRGDLQGVFDELAHTQPHPLAHLAFRAPLDKLVNID